MECGRSKTAFQSKTFQCFHQTDSENEHILDSLPSLYLVPGPQKCKSHIQSSYIHRKSLWEID